jgi:putative ABC transport system permease protein
VIKSFWRLQQVDPGFDPRNLLSVEITLPGTRYPESSQRTAFFQQALENISALPGVTAVSVINSPPLCGRRNIDVFPIEGRPAPTGIADAPLADFREISPDYFRMMGIRLLEGRVFTEGDAQNAPNVALISQAFATRYAAGEDLIGKRLLVGDEWHTVIGVVSDIRQSGLDEEAAPHVYTSYKQLGPLRAGILVRTEGDALTIVASVRAEIQRVDRDQPIYNVNSMAGLMATAIAPRRLNLVLLGMFALLALTLAAVGIYGVMANMVTQRTGEIGLRMALGAQPRDVLRLVVGHGLRLTLAGAAIGMAVAFAVTRVMTSLLFGVSATDPLTFAGVVGILAAASLLACYLPARRAMKVDPMVALRCE